MPSGCHSVLDSLAHSGKAALLGWISRNALLQVVSTLLLPHEIFLNCFLMIEVVRQTGMDVGKTQRRETQGNLFGRRPVLIVVQDGLQTHARVSDADGAIFRG